MKIISVEPTPNPNSMKLNMDEALPEGLSFSFTTRHQSGAPAYLARLLAVPGVRSVYQVADFIALGRGPGGNWQEVLAGARKALEQPPESAPAARPFGEVRVSVQMLRGVPMQVKAVSGESEHRAALPDRFRAAATRVAAAIPEMLKERQWQDRGIRYGDLREAAEEAADQIASTYDDARLETLVERALAGATGDPAALEPLAPDAVAERLKEPDWRRRYAAVELMEPAEQALPVILTALDDPHPSVRRLAVAYLGEVGGDEVMPHLLAALQDKVAAVRRAAGDALSDVGDPVAVPSMIIALADPSRLVRWRAARFLYEVGDAGALPALQAAADDPEFEVSLQVRMAIERIEGGHAVVEPAWKQMTKGFGP